ncbi:DEAD/DEAH box helicase [Paenibacillus sp. RUD330]|uniref:DEAD/DEAH box helicase n=1 Tax=Paenibacillus sp. RUD330 TaxID=2023772 RepID=UPI000B927F69|nr:DEAD/DEAH box helicase [Paenibacillus sp. RUD330]ASS67375.1 DEAD/DEAH box helicase [Paenibacillus sp. RUD330]
MTTHRQPDPSLNRFHPVLAHWFAGSFGSPTDIQRRAWASIGEGEHTLLAAPTGSGKTLAALLPCLDLVLRSKEETGESLDGSMPPAGVRVIYVTPLKALNNDIYDHVAGFVEEIGRQHEQWLAPEHPAGYDQASQRITCAVRTGDTPASKRAAMLRKPPDVLVTTPESLYILLGSAKGRTMLRTTRQVIVDEIHDLAADKRGSHLSLTLERLEAWCGRPLQRIGLSATVRPMESVARFLGGWSPEAGGETEASDSAAPLLSSDGDGDGPAHPLGYLPRPVAIVESAMPKTMQVSVTMPDHSRLHRTRESVWFPIMDRLLQLMEGSRSTLVFVNSRRLAERLCLRMNDYTGREMCRAHHGSMDRSRRLEVERLLKAGELSCIVATSSLELGIDVGHVDLVIQIDSPLSAAAGIQRIGRAGHGVGEASRGVILSRQRGALPEIAVLSRMIAERDIEPIEIPRDALDVLSQQAVAMASGGEWTVEAMHRLIAGSDSYQAFPRGRLESMLAVLAGFYPFSRPLLEWDRGSGTVGPRSNSSMAAVTGAGTIPQSSAYPVHHADSRAHIGELDEEFVQESRVGDVFQLGTNSWMIRQISKDRVYVAETSNSFSEIPFWRNEAGSRSYLLGRKVAELWTELLERLEQGDEEALQAGNRNDRRPGRPPEAALAAMDGLEEGSSLPDEPVHPGDEPVIAELRERSGMDDRSARQLAALVRAQAASGVRPTRSRIAIEVYKDISNQTHIVIHNAWGRRVNRTWQLAIERRFEEALPYRLYGNAKDNGIEFVLPEWEPSWLQAVHSVSSDNLPELLLAAIPGSPLLAVAFRRIAETSLLLSRSFTRTPMWQMRLRSEELLRAALPYGDRFPYLAEAMRECMNVYLDLGRLRELLREIESGGIVLEVVHTSRPSPLASQFAADYVNMRIYEGDGLDGAVRAQLLQMSRELAGELFGAEALRGAVAPEVLEAERERLGRLAGGVRSEDDLYRLLKLRGDLEPEELLRLASSAVGSDEPGFAEPDGRAEADGWLTALRRQGRVAAYMPGGPAAERLVCADEAGVYAAFPEDQDSVSFIIERYISHLLSFTEQELAERYPALGADGSARLVSRLLEADRIQAAPFAEKGERLYASSLIAARVVRLSVQHARSRSEAADAVRWCGQMALRQHALQGSQLRGEHGLLQVLQSLQGFYFPLSHWESFILPSRLAAYRPEELDLLCASGEVLWLGRKEPGEKEGKIAFFLRDSRELYAPYLPRDDGGSAHPALLQALKAGGASFLTRIARDVGLPPSEAQEQLLELVWEGLVSNDQFAPLRAVSSAKPRSPKGRPGAWGGSGLGRWFWTGSLEGNAGAGPAERPAAADGSAPGGSPSAAAASARQGAAGTAAPPVASRSDSGTSSHEAVHPPAAAAGRQLAYPAEDSPALRWINHLLESYGILSRDLVAAVSPFSWDELLPLLKRLEEWGVLVRGFLIAGMPSMQFATREMAEAVRHPLPQDTARSLTVLSAADPANPFGLVADWPQEGKGVFARKPGNYLVLENGRWLYWIENNARKIHPLSASEGDQAREAEVLQEILRTIAIRQGLSRVIVEQWNGSPVDDTRGAGLLRDLGAEKDRHRFVLWKSQLKA